MKRLAFFVVTHFLLTGVNAQDAIQPSAMPIGNAEGSSSDEYYFNSPQQINGKTYIASLFKSPGIKLGTYSYLDKALTKKNGVVVGYNVNGDTQYTGNYHRNKLFGEWRSWYENRQQCDSGRIVNDVPDGEWKGWY